MKNKKLLTALASTAGLAAVITPAMCMTGCSKSHFTVTEAAKAGKKTFTIKVKSPTLSDVETIYFYGIYISSDGKEVDPEDVGIFTSNGITFTKGDEEKTITVGLTSDDFANGKQVKLVCFAYEVGENKEVFWSETLTYTCIAEYE